MSEDTDRTVIDENGDRWRKVVFDACQDLESTWAPLAERCSPEVWEQAEALARGGVG